MKNTSSYFLHTNKFLKEMIKTADKNGTGEDIKKTQMVKAEQTEQYIFLPKTAKINSSSSFKLCYYGNIKECDIYIKHSHHMFRSGLSNSKYGKSG